MNTIAEIKAANYGFIICEDDLKTIVKENRFERLLVRCGGGRFIVAAQDAEHFMGIIRKEGSDYVRDLSFLSE
jgi:hypothetical protein